MAYINVDEVYILDNTGAQVDAVTDIPFKQDAGLTDAQKAQARQNLGISGGGGGGGRNLLDNPWFTVNQRGWTSGTANNVYTVDRWKTSSSSSYTVAVNADGSLTINALFYQKVSNKFRTGTVLTISYMKSDGTIVSKTGTITSSEGFAVGNNAFGFYYRPSTGVGDFQMQLSGETVVACKLELGSVSTLANDAPPDYGTELAKCMRYFIRLNAPAWGCNFGIGRATNATTCSVFVPLPVPLRASPTVSVNGIGELQLIGNGGGGNASACSYAGRSESGVNLSFTASGLTTSHLYTLVRNGSTSCYIDLSADL